MTTMKKKIRTAATWSRAKERNSHRGVRAFRDMARRLCVRQATTRNKPQKANFSARFCGGGAKALQENSKTEFQVETTGF